MNVNTMIYHAIRPLGGLHIAKLLTATHPKIFMYHRVNPRGEGGAMTCETFREQLKIIKRDFQPMLLSGLLGPKNAGERKRNSVVITFDDGYDDFYHHAFPILLEEQVPATIFVATGFIDGEVWLWPDQIAYLLERTDVKQVVVKGLGEVSIMPDWRTAWHQIADYCLALPNKKKLQLIAEMASLLNVVLPKLPPDTSRPLTWEQLRQMSKTGLVEVGSHSHTHPVMSRLDYDELEREIALPQSRITSEIGQAKPFFCYPNGQPSDYTEEVKKALKNSGYKFGVVAYPGKRPLKDPFEIKRYGAGSSLMNFEKALYGLTRLAMH